MKILLFRSNNIFDSRVSKYHNYYERAGLVYTIVGWDRKGENLKKEHYDFFKFKAGEDVGGIKAICNHFKWMLFVYKYLKLHSDVSTIHACDLNSAFPAAIFKVLHKRSVSLIFDACDWYSANFVKNKLLSWLFNIMERFTVHETNELIICEPEREEQIQFKLQKKPLVMPNIPDIDVNKITEVQERFKFNNEKPVLAYMGFFGADRFLEQLLTLAEREPFNLLIAGYGNKEVMDKCKKVAIRDNVKYFGRVDIADGLNMENAADVVYAMYCKNIPNHIYAAPNKYYEAMMLGKPLITTKGTIPGGKVEKYGTGWAIEESVEELRILLRGLNKADIEERGQRASFLWDKSFKNYIHLFFENTYSKILR